MNQRDMNSVACCVIATTMPWRGSTNAPYLIPLTVRRMAAVLGVAVATLCAALSENSERVYGPW